MKKNIRVFIVAISSFLQCYSQADNYVQKQKEKDAQSKSSSQQMHFILVFKSHFDIGYSALAKDVLHEYRSTMIDRALDVIDINKKELADDRFVWTVPGWPLSQMLWDRQTPQRRQRIEEAIRNGNLVFHALPFTIHTAIGELEELVRSMTYSTSLSNQFKMPLPTDAKMTDVPAHSWILPTLLHKAGVNFFHLGANPTNQEVKLPDLFWWEGPDGSRVLTMYAKGYSAGLFPPDGWKYHTWLAIAHAGDNQGPPTAEEVKSFINEIKTKFPNAKITVGKMADFANEVLKENLDIPVIRGDMSDSWIHGPMSMPQEVQLARHIGPLIPALDVLSTQSQIWGIQPFSIQEDITNLYEDKLRFIEHTWGMANQHFVPGKVGNNWYKNYVSGLDPAYQHMQESWKEHGEFITQAKTILNSDLDNALNTLAENVAVKGLRIVVFNPLPYKRTGVVNFTFPFGGMPGNNFIQCVDDKTTTAFNVLGDLWQNPKEEGLEPKRLGQFIASDVPAMGYRTYIFTDEPPSKIVSDIAADKENHVIENKYFKISFDMGKGCIKSIINKTDNKEMINAKADNSFGQYVYERYSKKEELNYLKSYIFDTYKNTHYQITAKEKYLPDSLQHINYTPDLALIEINKSNVGVTAMLYPSTPQDENKHNASLTVSLYANQPFIDIKLSVINKPATEIPEAGWFCFPFAIDQPQFRIGVVGSVIDPSKDLLEGSNFNYIWSNSGVAIMDNSGKGYGICPLDAPALALGKTGFVQFEPKWEDRKANVYFNLFNNKWNTNFQSFWSGNITSAVRIWAFENYNNESSLITPATEARTPLLCGMAKYDDGKLANKATGVSLSAKGISVTAFGKNPDGEGTILRLWEQGGRSVDTEVILSSGSKFTSAIPVNLRGEKLGEPIKIIDGKFIFPLKAYAPASFILNEDPPLKNSETAPVGARFIDALRKGKRITIVTMGTSLTGGTWRWPDVMMSEWLDKEFPGKITFFNEGVGASASSAGPGNNYALSGLGKLSDVFAHNPDVVFIEFATNDAYLPFNISQDDSRKNLNKIIDRILEVNPKTEIILQTMNSVVDKSGTAPHASSDRPFLAEYVQGYRVVAKDRGFLIVDNYSNWSKLMKDDPARFDKLVPDGLHPQQLGYKEILLPEMKKILDPIHSNKK